MTRRAAEPLLPMGGERKA